MLQVGAVVVAGRVVVAGGGAGFVVGAGGTEVTAGVVDALGGGVVALLGGVVCAAEGKDGVAVTSWEATGLAADPEVGTAWGGAQPAPRTTTRSAA